MSTVILDCNRIGANFDSFFNNEIFLPFQGGNTCQKEFILWVSYVCVFCEIKTNNAYFK